MKPRTTVAEAVENGKQPMSPARNRQRAESEVAEQIIEALEKMPLASALRIYNTVGGHVQEWIQARQPQAQPK